MRPLEDIRILAIEQYGAGPWGTVHLADLGAEIIKIEDPHSGGDIGRYVPPFREGGNSLFFETFNRNKRSITLDLRDSGGRKVFEHLVRVSDAVYANVRGDVPAKLGIRYSDLAEHNPRIVCCALSAFGATGSKISEPGYDYLLQGLTGWMHLTGEPDAPPTKTGLSLVDFSGGFVAAMALLIGIHAARRDGKGMDCDVSLFDTAVSLLTYVATWHLNGGPEVARTHHSAHPSVVPFQNFRTANGWIVVACPKEKFWRAFVRVIGRSELADDPRFCDGEQRYANRDALRELLEDVLVAKTSEEWLEDMVESGVPAAPVLSVPEALDSPEVTARGLIIETDHPVFGKVRQIASPVRVGGASPGVRRAPLRHEDIEYVLKEVLGYDEAQSRALAKSGAFGQSS